MAETENTYEEKLEIRLGYESFISDLNKLITGYNTTLKNINTINTSVGKSFDGFAKQVNSSLSTMSSNVSKKVEESVRATSQVVHNATKEIRQFQQNADKSLSAIDKRIVEMGKSKKEYLKRLSTIDDYTISESWKKDLKGEATEKHVGNVKRLRSEIIALEQEHFKQTNNISKTTMHSIVAVSEASAKAIGSTVNALSQNLNKVRQFTGKTEEDIAKILQSKGAFKAIENQQKQINDQVERLGKDRLLAYQNVEQSKIALTKQTEGVLRQEALKTYQENQQYLERINVAYKKAKENQLTLAHQMKMTREKVDTQTSKLRGDLQEGFTGGKGKAIQNLENMKLLLNEMTSNLSQLGTKGTTDILQLQKSFNTLDTFVARDINKLKDLINLTEKLATSDIHAKGMLPDLKNTLNQLESYKNKLKESSNLVKEESLTGPLVKAGQHFKDLQVKANSSLSFIKLKMDEFRSINLTSVFNIEQALKSWKFIEKEANNYGKIVNNIQKEISINQQNYEKYSVLAAKNAGTEKEAVYKAYADAVAQHIEILKNKEIAAKNTISKIDKEQLSMREKLISSSKQYMTGVMSESKGWAPVKDMQKEFLSLYEQITVSSTRMTQKGKANTEQLASQFIELRDKLILYREEIDQAINGLKRLTSKGVIDATPQIQELEKIKKHYDGFTTSLRSKSAGVEKMMRAQAQKVEQSWSKTLWETVRNFRWQYAALYYLVTQAVSGIKNYFLNVLQEVSDFRRSIYAITAAIGMNMGNSFKTNFDSIYNFSRNLVERLQAKAAQSYATLEDMMMVTRSFAQAGIFPKTDEDIDRVNTLATAVKVMTEGMANAGTQMRQEIMALIEGRSRVTDSVALAFKMQGINLKKEMEEWEKLGISKLEGFAKLLAPFAEINKRISQEYDAQVNNLKEIWKYIRRLAVEGLGLNIAQDIKSFVASLGIPGKELTALGEKAVNALKGSYTVLYEILKNAGVILKDIFGTVYELYSSIGNFGRFLDESTGHLSTWAALMRDVLKLMTYITTAARVAILPFYTLTSWVNSFALSLYAVKQLLSGDLTAAAETLKEAGEKAVAPFGQMKNIWDGYKKGISDATTLAKKLDETIKTGSFSDANSLLQGTENFTKIMKSVTGLYDEWDKAIEKNANKQDKATNKIANWKEEWGRTVKLITQETANLRESIDSINKEIEKTPKSINKTLQSIRKQNIEVEVMSLGTAEKLLEVAENNGMAVTQMSDGILDGVKTQIKEAQGLWQNFISWVWSVGDFLNKWIPGPKLDFGERPEYVSGEGKETSPKKANVFEEQKLKLTQQRTNAQERLNALNEELINGTKKLEEATKSELDKAARGQKTVIDYTKEYYDLLERLGGLDPFTKIWLEYKSNVADIAKAAQENSVVQEHYNELMTAANKKYWYEYTKAVEEAKDQHLDILRKITMTELGELSKIEEEYKNYKRTVMELYFAGRLGQTKEINEALKEEALALADVNVELAKQKKLQEFSIEIKGAYLDLVESQAKYLSESMSFSDQRQAQLLQEEAAYERYRLQVVATLKDINEKWGKDAPAEVAQYTSILQQNLDIQARLLEKHKNEIMNPFWEDMKKMSQEWVDDVSSSAADVIMKTKTLAEAATEMINSMFKEILTSFIKHNLMRPLMDQIQGVNQTANTQNKSFLSSITGMFGQNQQQNQNLLGNVTAANPLPVMVTNIQSAMAGGGLVSGDTAAATKEVIEGTKQSINSNVNSGFSGIWNNVKSGFSGLFGMLSNGFSGIMNLLGQVTSGIGSMFGGGSSGGSGGGLGSMLSNLFGGWSGTTAMKDGGTIQEPIFGVGLRTSKTYSFGEVQDEIVTPMSEYRKQIQGAANEVRGETHIHMPITLSAIDTQSGVDFLMKHSNVLEGQIIKGLKGNRKIRKSVRQSF